MKYPWSERRTIGPEIKPSLRIVWRKLILTNLYEIARILFDFIRKRNTSRKLFTRTCERYNHNLGELFTRVVANSHGKRRPESRRAREIASCSPLFSVRRSANRDFLDGYVMRIHIREAPFRHGDASYYELRWWYPFSIRAPENTS